MLAMRQLSPIATTLAGLTPAEVISRWPIDQPLTALCSGRLHPRWARWSILAPPRGRVAIRPAGITLDGETPDAARGVTAGDPLHALACVTRVPAASFPDDDAGPFAGGWIGGLSYDLGRLIEPAAVSTEGTVAVPDRAWPLAEFAWCPDAVVHDALDGSWRIVGDRTRLAPVIDALCEAPALVAPPVVGDLVASMTPDDYIEAVARTVEHIRAGDIFQANITRRLSAGFEGSTRRLFTAALRASGAWYAAYDEAPDGRRLASISPELFLAFDPASRRVVTRPIKGTRPGSSHPAELEASVKDAAELHMIVDLMRNDLGRVCRYGSVRVPQPRMIETHPTVHHGVAEVVGELRDDATLVDLLRASFPGGSITGAPKIRAMQIIDALEPVRRGPYCGSYGFIDRTGRAMFNIAIRTLSLHGGMVEGRCDLLQDGLLDYGAGCGIVADSDPVAELHECVQKTAVLRLALDSLATRSVAGPLSTL